MILTSQVKPWGSALQLLQGVGHGVGGGGGGQGGRLPVEEELAVTRNLLNSRVQLALFKVLPVFLDFFLFLKSIETKKMTENVLKRLSEVLLTSEFEMEPSSSAPPPRRPRSSWCCPGPSSSSRRRSGRRWSCSKRTTWRGWRWWRRSRWRTAWVVWNPKWCAELRDVTCYLCFSSPATVWRVRQIVKRKNSFNMLISVRRQGETEIATRYRLEYHHGKMAYDCLFINFLINSLSFSSLNTVEWSHLPVCRSRHQTTLYSQKSREFSHQRYQANVSIIFDIITDKITMLK